MMPALAQWVFHLMVFLAPPRQNDVVRLRELEIVALATAAAADTQADAASLTAIAYYESNFRVHAHGALGEAGAWQLMSPAPKSTKAQAVEALRRLHVQGWRGYTGEANAKRAPLAAHRQLAAAMLLASFADES